MHEDARRIFFLSGDLSDIHKLFFGGCVGLEGAGFNQVDPVAGGVSGDGHSGEAAVGVEGFGGDAEVAEFEEGVVELADEEGDAAEIGAVVFEDDAALALAEVDVLGFGGDVGEAGDAFVELAEECAGGIAGGEVDCADGDEGVDRDGGGFFGGEGCEEGVVGLEWLDGGL